MAEMPLRARRCVPCEGGVPPLGEEQIRPLLARIEGWEVEQAEGHPQLVKTFRFPDFVQAVGFVNRITPVAESEGHHPDLLVGWGRVKVQLWTHAAGGLTENDFILADKIDEVASGAAP
ncbi:MAG TPA: 4a-hydroxytetrahydrobiopterin dehydratase [Candidatus Dormibacteraeota bacterium]|jgi:4a-hydroxytetrahydrobiopterin dehydratase|nr:4a-hydroxytetrahydrobiopterin dehydratase [Candidatus Dormibacteraeota bacterium]